MHQISVKLQSCWPTKAECVGFFVLGKVFES
jgi:hypothetical protein